MNIKPLYKAAKQFVEAYEREQRHESQAAPVNWSDEKQRAYGKLLDCVIGRMSRETICDAAIELAEACKPKVKPEANEVYRDIFVTVPLEDFMNPTFKRSD